MTDTDTMPDREIRDAVQAAFAVVQERWDREKKN
ncbi:hypothetical protein ROJ8625_04104 [Roseivivax jejudonensis]|uniref:Uncharacterized protein n=1 Tax=Roseivivax jejudonensis TaxID=1529041 RepID=A0A1X7AAW7_9RHOB|nr:hypothetical protein ROJ8625_04104 [Roseivivax jejudonensis]